jgi:uncharacterized protein
VKKRTVLFSRYLAGLMAALLVVIVFAGTGCSSSGTSTAVPAPSASGTPGSVPGTSTSTPELTPSTTVTPEPTAIPAAPTPSPSPSSTPSPTAQDPYAMETLFSRTYPGGEIVPESVLQQNGAYTSYLISYPSDNLKIYGVMRIPVGNGPFPVIVMNHGHYDPATYISGQGTDNMADILARNGYLTLASDYRGHGKSEGSPASAGNRTVYGIDTLNLIASIPSVPEADGSRIGMWGHSMGGEVSMVVSEVSKQIKASVVWAPTSGDATVNAKFYSRFGAPAETLDGATSAAQSPLYFVDHVSAPISLHQGDIDTQVDPQWAIRWRDRLQAAGKQVEFYWYPGQGHNFTELGWGVISPRTIEFYDSFLKK